MPTTAEKLRGRMQATKAGWTADDLDSLYEGFGFTYRDGGKHRVYSHPTYPTLIATVKRGNKLPVGYVQVALKLLDRLDELKQENDPSGGRTP